MCFKGNNKLANIASDCPDLQGASCYSTQYSYVRETNTLDNGKDRVTEVKGSEYNSDVHQQPISYRKVYGFPSFNPNQVATNKIGGYSNYREYSSGFGGGGGRLGVRGFYTNRGRTVESPAIIADLGGNKPDMTSALSKIFHVKQGFYSDLYNDMDHSLAKTSAEFSKGY